MTPTQRQDAMARAEACSRAGDHAAARTLYLELTAADPGAALYHRKLGESCHRLGRFDEAVAAATRACRLNPDDVDAHFNLALACADAGNPAGADQARRNVLLLQEPLLAAGTATPVVWNRQAIVLHLMERFEEARRCYETALAMQPAFPSALNALAALLRETGETCAAVAHYRKVLELAPAHNEARLGLAMAQLYLGEWEEGWNNYEARWAGSAESRNGTFARPPSSLPQWGGETDTAGQGLLLFAEQGFGDLFQFVRYIDLALGRFRHVGLVCPMTGTGRLLEWSYGGRVRLLQQMPSDSSPWHWQCPLMSLPRAFRSTPQTVPAHVPYLKVAPQVQAAWHARLAARAPRRVTVGVAWQGRRTHVHDKRRSLQLAQMLALLQDQRYTWVSLQKLDAGQPRPAAPAGVDWVDWTDELTDFGDTAALIANLDLVITVDTAIAHLAGAMGKPVWLLNRHAGEWRWMQGREDSPWYPTMRIFTQRKEGKWDDVVERMAKAL